MAGISESSLLALLIGTMTIYFLAQWPAHARAAAIDPSVPLQARLGGALLATVFLMPLIVMAIGQVASIVLSLFGAKIDGRKSRLALIWALATVAPLMLLSGLVEGFIGRGPALTLVQAMAGLAFVCFWVIGLRSLVRLEREA